MAYPIQLSARSSVQDFLDGLRRPCGHLLNAFVELGVEEEHDIDALCLASSQDLERVKRYLVQSGMTQFLWIVIMEGLNLRAERLSSQTV